MTMVDDDPAGTLRANPLRIGISTRALFDLEEEHRIFEDQGVKAYAAMQLEREDAILGPFGNFLRKLSALRRVFLDEGNVSKVRIALVTARNAPAHERVIRTLRAWGTPADEAHFVGSHSKAPILKALGAHIFFDDQEKHVLGAAEVVAAGHVPGPHDPNTPVIPAG